MTDNESINAAEAEFTKVLERAVAIANETLGDRARVELGRVESANMQRPPIMASFRASMIATLADGYAEQLVIVVNEREFTRYLDVVGPEFFAQDSARQIVREIDMLSKRAANMHKQGGE